MEDLSFMFSSLSLKPRNSDSDRSDEFNINPIGGSDNEGIQSKKKKSKKKKSKRTKHLSTTRRKSDNDSPDETPTTQMVWRSIPPSVSCGIKLRLVNQPPDNQDFQSSKKKKSKKKKSKRTENLPTTSRISNDDSPDETTINQMGGPDNQDFQSKKGKHTENPLATNRNSDDDYLQEISVYERSDNAGCEAIEGEKTNINIRTTIRNSDDDDTLEEVIVYQRIDNASCEVIEGEEQNINISITNRNSDNDSLEEVAVYQISDNVRAEGIKRIVEYELDKRISSCNLAVAEGEKNIIIAAIEKDCTGILQRIILTGSSLSGKTFSLEGLKSAFNQYGCSEMWNVFLEKTDGFTAQDYENYMKKIKKEKGQVSTPPKY